MKSPWQMGLLAVAITGVSAYDIMFFKQYLNKDKAPIAIQSGWEDIELETFHFESTNESSSPEDFDTDAYMESHPVLSREELQHQAKQAFIPGDFPTATDKSIWPSRDPFKTAQRHTIRSKNTPRTVLPEHTRNDTVSAPAPASASEPQCTLSGTLIEPNRRLALINGTPRSTGEWLDGWQLAIIGNDYIILESGKNTRRIELNDISSHTMNRKDPL